MSQSTLRNSEEKFKIVYENWSNGEVTFKGKYDYPVQRWFRLTPAYSPVLVQRILSMFECDKNDIVLDPFAGSGTTLIECKRNEINSIGIDINPIFYEVLKAETEWSINTDEIKISIKNLLDNANKLRKENKELSLIEIEKRFSVNIPKITNLERWWRNDVLKDLLFCKKALQHFEDNKKIYQFLKMGLLSILIDVANIKRSHPTLTFSKRDEDIINVIETLENRLNVMLDDLNTVKKNSYGKTKVIHGDSTNLSKYIDSKIDFVITSPPYPNRISYVWETRPHLYFFDIFSIPRQGGELDCITIGGTWGIATSILDRDEIKPIDKNVDVAISSITDEIRKKDNLMANYVMKYFNMMAQHIYSLSDVIKKGGKCAYVVGNSRIKSIEVPTDEILADIFSRSEFTVNKILRIRKRIGRSKTYEAVIFVTKN